MREIGASFLLVKQLIRATPGGPQYQAGAGQQEDQGLIRGLELSVPHPLTSKKGKEAGD